MPLIPRKFSMPLLEVDEDGVVIGYFDDDGYNSVRLVAARFDSGWEYDDTKTPITIGYDGSGVWSVLLDEVSTTYDYSDNGHYYVQRTTVDPALRDNAHNSADWDDIPGYDPIYIERGEALHPSIKEELNEKFGTVSGLARLSEVIVTLENLRDVTVEAVVEALLASEAIDDFANLVAAKASTSMVLSDLIAKHIKGEI